MKENEFINDISFDEAYHKIGRADIDYLIKGDMNAKYSIQLKKLFFLMLGLFMPVMMIISYAGENENIKTTTFSRVLAIVVAAIFIVLLLGAYIKSNSLFKNYGYRSFIYISLKILFLSYICGSVGSVNADYSTNLITLSIYIPTCLYLYYSTEKNMLKEYVNVTFGKNYKTHKIWSLLVKLAGTIMILGVAIVQLYRLNRWWLDTDTINDATSSFDLSMTLTVIVGAIFMIAISLIPTYLAFRANLTIQNQLVMKYSEEFREAYGYYKEEWEA